MSFRILRSGVMLFSVLIATTGMVSASTCPTPPGGSPRPGPAISITSQNCTKSTVFVGDSVASFLTVTASDIDYCGDPYPVSDTLTYTWSQTTWTSPGTYTVTCRVEDAQGPGYDGYVVVTFYITVKAVDGSGGDGGDGGVGPEPPPPSGRGCG